MCADRKKRRAVRDIADTTSDYERWLAGHAKPVRDDLRHKHRCMAEDPFSFLRATFYQWAHRWALECPELADAPVVQAVGDIHVENFGTWRDAEGRLVWGVNDFDEAHPLPYANDLVRLATSARVAGVVGGLTLSPAKACDAILAGYAKFMTKGGAPFVLAENNPWLRRAVFGLEREPVRFWERLNALPASRKPPAGVGRILRDALPEGFTDLRIAHRRAGLGSLGRERYTAIALAGGSCVAREAKALAPSACVWASGGEPPARASLVPGDAVHVPDPFSGVAGNWILRRLSPHCCRIELDQLDRRGDERKLLKAMGKELANIHLGTPAARDAVLRDLARRPDDWLLEDSARMTDAVLEDWRDWRKVRRP